REHVRARRRALGLAGEGFVPRAYAPAADAQVDWGEADVDLAGHVFVGHGVMFVNDRHPRATAADGSPQGPDDGTLDRVIVDDRASIGSGAVVVGVPARLVRATRDDAALVGLDTEGVG
ncbi:MAG: hypothetical protein ABI317_06390, partial [Gaiellales bacterium]